MFQFGKLDNGLEYIIEQRPGRTFGLVIALRGGSAVRESSDTRGRSHLLEHMMFDFRRPDPSGKSMIRKIENVGGYANAETDKDGIFFELRLPAKNWVLGFNILAEAICRPSFLAQTAAYEKTIIEQEIVTDHQEDEHLAHDDLEQALWPNHPMSLDEDGDVLTVQKTSLGDLRNLWRFYQYGHRIVVAVVGPTKIEQVKNKIANLFGDLPPLVNPGPDILPPRVITKRRLMFRQNGKAGIYCALSFPVPSLADPNRIALGVLSNILGGKCSSRLYVRVRENRGLAYNVSADVWHYRLAGLLKIDLDSSDERLPEALEIITAELKDLKTNLVSVEELTEAKGNLIGRAIINSDDPRHTAKLLAGHALRGAPIVTVRQYIKVVKNLTRQQIRRLARRTFLRNHLVLVVYGKTSPRTISAARRITWQL